MKQASYDWSHAIPGGLCTAKNCYCLSFLLCPQPLVQWLQHSWPLWLEGVMAVLPFWSNARGLLVSVRLWAWAMDVSVTKTEAAVLPTAPPKAPLSCKAPCCTCLVVSPPWVPPLLILCIATKTLRVVCELSASMRCQTLELAIW